jgi:transmembrane sensor
MSKEVFFNLLRKYLEGKCTAEEKRIVEQWYGMLDDEELPALQEAELEEIGKKLWERVDHSILVQEKPIATKTFVRHLWPAIAVAASFIGFVMVYTIIMYNRPPASMPVFVASAESIDIIKKENTGSTPIAIQLQDASTVTLQPGATLTYPASFEANRREVMIDGEGFFEVTKNTERPFFVYSQGLVTQVVGTSFIVKAHEHDVQSEVTVLTGRVIVMHHEERKSVYQRLIQGSKKEVELTPNYKAIYTPGTNSLSVTIADDPVVIQQGTRTGSFVFNSESVKDVLDSIETAYGIQINAGLEIDQCTFTGDLSGQNLREQLEFICQTIGANYTVNGTEINLKGGNCSR